MSTSSNPNAPAGEPIVYQRRGFWSLFAAAFQEAFNDLSFRTLVTFFVLGLGLSQADRNSLVSLTLALFALPFLLFSMIGGYLADRYSKRDVSIALKAVELFSMSLGVLALALGSVPLLLTVVFLISAQSALFGPSKWGLLPELLPEKKLSWGNGILQFATYISGIAGTVAGGALSEAYQGRTHWAGVILVGTAFLGLLVTFGISRTPRRNSSRQFRLNQFAELFAQLRLIRQDRGLTLAVLGNGYFLFLATLLQANILRYGKDVLVLGDTQNGLLQAAVAVGIGVGALAAGYVSGNKIELGLIPLGAIGLVVASATLSLSGLTFPQVAASLVALGFAGGFFIVPIGALIQYRPDASVRGGVIATANWLSWAGALLAAGVDYLLASVAGFTPSTVFLFGAVLTLAGALFALTLLPDALLRFMLWAMTVTIYRIRVLGRDNIPEKGGALFVANHLSMIDALLVQASTDRPIHFLMDREWHERHNKPWLKPFVKLLQMIPVSPQATPRELLRSLREAHEVVVSGGVVCISAEGQVTRTGKLLPFRRGFERIMRGPQGLLDAPIIPVHVDNLWGSIFSYEHGRFTWRLPRRIPYPVIVSYGQPLPAGARAAEVKARAQELQPEAFQHHREWLKPLHRYFLATARRHPLRFAMADARVPKLSWLSALLKTIFLGRRLRKVWAGQDNVGILLPPSVAGALVNYAALIGGKVPVNLNYTASNEIIADCAKQCGLKTVITSRAFLEKVPLQVPGETILLEDLAQNPRSTEKLLALLLALLPAGLIERALGSRRRPSLDDVATVIFSSGSTGLPKGVVLTQFNIAANIEQAGQALQFLPDDRILGVLPFFHSFGFMGGLWLPAVVRIGIVFHPNPTEAKAIGELIHKHRVTILISTPTFLQGYIRRCEPEELGSLRVVVTGAEKLPQRVVEAFEERFGLRPLEAYGCTECAPLVAANTGDLRPPSMPRVGVKSGKIGQPVAGIAVRIVDPETGSLVPSGQPGLLLVRGPNVMIGYLGMPEKTAEVLRDGWYSTGDMAFIDDDGFIEITDRLSRFSKIGGEMVPHMKIEDTLQTLAGITEQVFAVTGLPDEKKGERLIVLHTLDDERLADCAAQLASAAGLPNLWKPDKRAFYRVEAIPYLGTGKMDLRRIRELAKQLTSAD